MLISQIIGALLAIKRRTWRFAFSIKVFTVTRFLIWKRGYVPKVRCRPGIWATEKECSIIKNSLFIYVSIVSCLIFCLFVFVPSGDGKVPGPWLQRRTRVSSLSWKKARKAEERLVKVSERHQKKGGSSLSENKHSQSAWTVVYIYRNQMATLFNSVQLCQFSMRTAI